MYYYHMTSLNSLNSIAVQGLVPKNGNNGKLIGEEKVKVFFSEGFEGAVALFVDFELVFEQIKNGQMEVTDELVKRQLLKSESLSEYLGEGVYLRFDGAGIKNERNFENGCTDRTIPPEDLSVCILRKRSRDYVVFSRFEIIKYMMAKVRPEQIKYYGASYEGAPNFGEATKRIQEKVKRYYRSHHVKIHEYGDCGYSFEVIALKDFVRLAGKIITEDTIEEWNLGVHGGK